ncbi:response regulator transcription factor [Novosphingobium bradum]|uniref:Response regulator transcription factor n=1 Tax=Novosphingobium bradum TaxID=1737444 RepID=A0ABV7INF9_9SPHN
MKVAILDKDPTFRQALVTLVEDAGFHSTSFQSGRELMRSLQRDGHDLLVIDWDLPDLSGPNLLEGVRNQVGFNPPLLLLTAPLASPDLALALRTGADCVLAKPCTHEVLAAQVLALARRSTNCSELAVETFGEFRFELPTRRLIISGRALHLTPKEFTLALLLFRNLNRAVSRSYILETVWGIDPALSTRTIDIHISKIRTKLGLRPESGYRLSPVYGFGYRLEEYAG